MTPAASGKGFDAALASCAREGLSTPPADVIDAGVAAALREDIGDGDLSAALLPDRHASASIITRETAIVCGLPWAIRCFAALDPDARFDVATADGVRAEADATILTVRARARALVGAERCALNFLQTLSAVATETAKFAAVLEGTGTRVLDTRKTLPGLRQAQKYAVRAGGGDNHRMGLYDAVLIKENHIAAAGSIAAAVGEARRLGAGRFVEVEVETLAELEQALAAGAERIMLDEFGWDDLRRAVELNAGRAALEVSGSMDLDSVRRVATLGVDYVSVGALTKNVRAVDLSMRLMAD